VVSKEGDGEVPVFNSWDVETAERWQGFAFAISFSSSSSGAFEREQPSLSGWFWFAWSEELWVDGPSSVGKDAVGVSVDADGLVAVVLSDGFDMMMMVMIKQDDVVAAVSESDEVVALGVGVSIDF
jgi:hypothetical protein